MRTAKSTRTSSTMGPASLAGRPRRGGGVSQDAPVAQDSDRARQLHVVLGAAGGTGAAVVRELVGQGRSVRAVTRHGRTAVGDGAQPPASYQDAAADVTDLGSCAGRSRARRSCTTARSQATCAGRRSSRG